MKKAFSALLIAALLISLFSGCADGSGGAQGKTSTGQSPVTLHMSWWGSQTRHDATVAALELYMEQNQHVKIESEFSGWDGYWDKIATQAAAGSLPNVWQQSIAYLKQYAAADQILDMQPYVDAGLIDLSDWSQAAIDTGKVDGKLYSLSMGMTAHALVYDPDLFAQAGLEVPSQDWTWEEYLSAAKTIKDKLGIFGDETFPNQNSYSGMRHYVFSLGHTFFSADQKSLGFPKELAIEFLRMDYEGQKAGYIADEATQLEITTPEQSLIVTGDAAMKGAMNSNMCVALMEAAGKELGIVNYPHHPDESRWGTVLGPSMIINMTNRGTDAEKEESARLVNFILNDVDANMILLGERGVPSSSKVVDAIKEHISPYARLTFEYVSSVSPHLEADPDAITPPAGGEIINLYKRIHGQIMFDQITIEDGVDQFFKEANALLAAG